MRATNLQELVYKNGQAGITKASVSITFDNRDKKNSPVGYEHFDEVVIQRQVRGCSLIRGEICVANFIPLGNGASLGSYFV